MSKTDRGGVHSLFKALIAAVFLTGGVAITSPAYAINAQHDKISVSIDARDLETDRGIERVYRTLSRKADNACNSRGARPISERMAEKVCASRLLKDFIEDVDHAKLTAYHESQSSA